MGAVAALDNAWPPPPTCRDVTYQGETGDIVRITLPGSRIHRGFPSLAGARPLLLNVLGEAAPYQMVLGLIPSDFCSRWLDREDFDFDEVVDSGSTRKPAKHLITGFEDRRLEREYREALANHKDVRMRLVFGWALNIALALWVFVTNLAGTFHLT